MQGAVLWGYLQAMTMVATPLPPVADASRAVLADANLDLAGNLPESPDGEDPGGRLGTANRALVGFPARGGEREGGGAGAHSHGPPGLEFGLTSPGARRFISCVN